jgi:bifunctional non-homologous end joining protein LigD
MEAKTISLHCTEGGSDKVYHMTMKPEGGGFVIDASWGRRGSTLQTASKTPRGPVSEALAEKAWNRLLAEKAAKGYKVMGSDAPVMVGDAVREDSGLRPQLLNDISDEQLEALLTDEIHVLQEKWDGERRLIEIDNDKIQGINRKGQYVPLPQALVDELNTYEWPGRAVLDGEIMGEVYIAFDALWWDGRDITGQACSSRLATIERDIEDSDLLRVVETHYSPVMKRRAFEEIRQANGEGVVFRRPSAVYTPGKPASGGTQLKYKFWKDVDVILANGRDGKRSCGMVLYDDTHTPIFVGNVAIPANYDLPAPGEIGKVRYLYAYKNGCLYQPQFEGVRTDKTKNECLLSQLKYKRGEADDDTDN